MANNVVGSLIVNLGLETARLNSDTDKAARHFNSFEKKAKRSLSGVGRGVSRLMSGIASLTGIAGTLSVAGFGAMAKSAIDTTDKIGKLSDRIGASTEALSQYQHVAELSGVRFETLTMGWQRMTRRVAEAAQGTGEAKNALIELNLSAQDLNQLRPEDQFEVIADRLFRVENQADKVRLAMKLFDSEGVSLLQTMTGGADGIKKMREEANRLGLTLSDLDAKHAAKANDAMTVLRGRMRGLGFTLAKTLGPGLADIANWLSVNLPGAVQFASNAFDKFRIFVLKTVGGVGKGLSGFYGLLSNLPGWVGKSYESAKSSVDLFNESIDATTRKLEVAIGKAQEFTTTSELLNPGGGLTIDVGGADPEAEKEALQKGTRIHKKELTDRQKFAALSAKDQTKTVVGEAVALTAGVSRQNRSLFEANKAFGIANAVINAHAGATKSLATYPWPLAGVMAALHYSAGMAQVQAINSTSFGSSSGGTPPSSAGSVPLTDPSATTQDLTQTPKSGQQINVYIEGSAIGDDAVRETVINAIETAMQNDEWRP